MNNVDRWKLGVAIARASRERRKGTIATPMLKFIARHIVKFVLLMLAVSAVVFVLVSLRRSTVQANVGQAAYVSMSEAKRAQLASYWGRHPAVGALCELVGRSSSRATWERRCGSMRPFPRLLPCGF